LVGHPYRIFPGIPSPPRLSVSFKYEAACLC
jgi:hypothetical protein